MTWLVVNESRNNNKKKNGSFTIKSILYVHLYFYPSFFLFFFYSYLYATI